VRQIFSQVTRYAIATGNAERDPSPDLRGALAPVELEHHPAITDPREVAPLLRVLDGYEGSIVVQTIDECDRTFSFDKHSVLGASVTSFVGIGKRCPGLLSKTKRGGARLPALSAHYG